jgi:hypothetical protein
VAGSLIVEGSMLQIGDLTQGTAAAAAASLVVGQGIAFSGGARSTVDVESTAAGTPFTSTVNLIGHGDIIHLAGVDPTTASYNAGTGLVTYDIGTTAESFALDLIPGEVPTIVADDGGTDIGIACYLRGTRILTAHGEVAVEDLTAGDPVITRPGVARPIRWIGYRTIDLSRHPRPELARPVRIAAHAVAEGVPARDLWVSPDHAIYLNGVLIAARQLCNGATITREQRFRTVQYFHIELHTHGIIMAEGLPSESYLDTGNRGMFENTGGPLILHPDFAPGQDQAGRQASSCAPFATAAEQVEPVWRWLVDRAMRLGHRIADPATTSDPELRVLADGRVLLPVSVEGNCHRFNLRRTDGALRLVSLATEPCDLKPWLEDQRRLGVYVNRVVWYDAGGPHDIPLDHPSLGRGWWDVEREGGRSHRWTDGDAELHIPRHASALDLHVAGGMVWRATPPQETSDAWRAA